MNKLITILLLYIFLITATLISTNAIANDLLGSWEMVSGEYFNEKGETVAYNTHKLESIKLITASHYSFVTVTDVKLWAAGTGTYKLTPDYYIETVIHTSYGAPKGTQYTFKYKLEGDFWYHTRIENGERKEYEVWRKIQKPLFTETKVTEAKIIEAKGTNMTM
jgi:hypothetical protein